MFKQASSPIRTLVLVILLLGTFTACACFPPDSIPVSLLQTSDLAVDRTPRIAVATAYDPEFAALLPALQQAREYRLNGVSYWTGEMSGQPVVLFKTGVSIVNATMNAQRLMDKFNITRIVISGVAGGLDPAVSIGDVTVPRRWAKYDEATYLRETEPGVFTAPFPGVSSLVEPYGFMGTRGSRIASSLNPRPSPQLWFDADPKLLEIAAVAASQASLTQCDSQNLCLPETPEVLIGGSGVSGSVFMDNRSYRNYLYEIFNAEVVEMETAAIAMVAYANDVPFIAFRSVSDLAGGGEASQNEIRAFEHLAAQNSAELVTTFLKALSD